MDTYHYQNHKRSDELCREFCNPNPHHGIGAPNLVVSERGRDGEWYWKRAFNTQACEQLNAWIGGFSSILKHMNASNFNWFLHVMLYYHSKYTLEKLEEKGKLL